MARTTATTRATATTRTAISRRQTLRAGGSVIKNLATSGNTINVPFAAGSAIDVSGNQAVSFLFSMKSTGMGTNRLWSTSTVGTISVTVNSGANALFLQNVGGIFQGGSVGMDGNWHRYGIAFDGTNLSMWRDNVLVYGPTPFTPNWTANGTATMALGGNNGTQGSIDDWCYWKGYALTAADVANDWYDGTLPATPCSAHWTFDERFGTTVSDVTGNGFTGTITGGGFSDEVPPWSLPGTASKRYPDGFNPFAYLNGGAAYFSDLGATVAVGLISQLNDQSGNGWHMIQNTGANKPTYTTGGVNGKPYLVYSAFTGTFMATAANFTPANGASGITVYCVGSIAADHNGGSFVAHYSGVNGTFLIGQVGGSTGNFNSNVTAAAGVNNFGNTAIAPSMAQTAIWSFRYDGVHNRSFTNGRPKYQDAQGATSGPLSATTTTLALGDKGGGSGGLVNLYCAIIAIGAHDDDTMRWHHRYLSDYYQIPLLA